MNVFLFNSQTFLAILFPEDAGPKFAENIKINELLVKTIEIVCIQVSSQYTTALNINKPQQ
jgi:hypothetical protein